MALPLNDDERQKKLHVSGPPKHTCSRPPTDPSGRCRHAAAAAVGAAFVGDVWWNDVDGYDDGDGVIFSPSPLADNATSDRPRTRHTR